MSLRIIEVACQNGHADTLEAAAENVGAVDIRLVERSDGTETIRVLVESANSQKMLDALQRSLIGSEDWRINIIPVEATLPKPEAKEGISDGLPGSGATREEIYTRVAAGARLDSNFLLLVILSTAVAAIGLLADELAVIIGAMVIAPLLGPNLAFALGAALGDKRLMGRALGCNLVGLALVLAICVIAGFFLSDPTASKELMGRTHVGLDGVVLAFASGVAAVLSLTAGVSATLVGVMVAVALLPPTATIGIMAGAGHFKLAFGAAMLLAVNVVCVNLSAQLVFLWKGVRPNNWYERKNAQQYSLLNALMWIVLLAALIAVIVAQALGKLT